MLKEPVCGVAVGGATVLRAERDGKTPCFYRDEGEQQLLPAPVVTQCVGPLLLLFGASDDSTKTLFHRADRVKAVWKVAHLIPGTWASHRRENLPVHAPEIWGRPEAEQDHGRHSR